MADKKITALTESTSLSTDDLFHVVDSPSSSPSNKKITANNVFQKIPSWIGFADTVVTMAADALAVPVTGSIVHKTTGSDAESSGTITAGTQGQLLMIVLVTDGGGNFVIPASSSVADTITFADAEDTAQLLFTNSKWHFMGGTASIS